MGTFGTGPFENDDALDILDELFTPLVENINSEIDEWERRAAKKTSRKDTATIPALGQVVINLQSAVSVERLAKLSKRLMPCLDHMINQEEDGSQWSRRGDELDRLAVLRQIKLGLKEIIIEESGHYADRVKERDDESWKQMLSRVRRDPDEP